MSNGGEGSSRPAPDTAAVPAPRRRWRRRLAITAGVLVGLGVLVRVLLPTAIERGAAWAGPRYLGLPVRIANVDLALFSGAVTIEGLAIGSRADAVLPERAPALAATDDSAPAVPDATGADPEAAGAAEEDGTPDPPAPSIALADPEPEAPEQRELLLSWQRVHVELDYRSLFDRTVRLLALEIDAPHVRLERRADGSIDPLAHAAPTVAPAEREDEEPDEEAEGEPWAIAVEHLVLRDSDVRIADEARDVVLVDFGLEELALEQILSRGADLALGSIGLEGPVLRVRRDFVFAEDGAPPADAPPPGPAGADEPATDSSFRIDRIGIRRAEFVWITDAGPLDVALTFEAGDVTLDEGERFPVALAIEIGDGRLALDGRVGVLPPSYDGRITWQRLPFPPLLLAALPEIRPWLQSADSTGDLLVSARLATAASGAPGLWLSGPVSLETLALGDPNEEEVGLGWKALEVSIREVRAPLAEADGPAGETSVDLARVRLVEPDVWYALPTPALDALLGRGGEGAAPPTESEADTDVTSDAAEPEPTPVAAPAAEGTGEAAPTTPEDVAADEPAAPEEAPAATPPAGAPLAVAVETLDIEGGRLRFEDRRGGGGSLRGSVEGLVVAARALAVHAVGGDATVTLGSLTVDGSPIRFADARGAESQSGGIEGLHLVLDDLAVVPGADAPSVSLAKLALDAGSIQFEDEKVEPTYRGRLRDLVVRAEGLRFPERVARSLRATGASADGGRFELTGSLDGDTGEAMLDLKGLALAPFNPYTTQAAGYRIAGDASLETNLRMRGARYDARSRIVLGGFDVSSQDPGDFERRFGVPLDLALALLRDPTGNISLSIPVSVDETGTRTGVATIVAGALRQALIGAITSPLKMLGSVASGVGGLFGGDGAGIAPIAMAPGATAPEPGQGDRYEGIVKLLSERPELAVRLHGRAGPDDRPRVAEQMLIERLEAGDGLPDLEEGAGFLQRRRLSGALEDRGRGEPGELDPDDAAMLERYIAAVDVPDKRLAALARARAEAVREIAVSEYGVTASHVPLGDPAPPGAPAVLLELTPAP